jgi:hypothetical protein
VASRLSIVKTDQHSRWPAVASHHDSLMLALDAVDELREAILDVPQRIGRHGHDVRRARSADNVAQPG